ncbi:MAG: carbohydrate binding protein, partial [Oscillospiraceae bacterium]|nr:carbohydrate binding protein [Oscillospiraceae bacterium]
RIKERYKQVTYNSIETEVDRWLVDNFYIIDKEGKTLLKDIEGTFLPFNKVYKLPDVYIVIKELVFDESFEFSTKSMMEFVTLFEQTRYIKNFELEFLRNAIKIAAIEAVYICLFGKFSKEKAHDMISRAILTIADIDTIDFDAINRAKNNIDKVLKKDLNGSYSSMNEETKKTYRYKISKLSIRLKKDEDVLANEYIELAGKHEDGLKSHVGYYIYRDYGQYIKNPLNPKIHIPLLFWIPAIISLLVAVCLRNLWVSLLIYIPIWEVLRPFLEYITLDGVEHEYAPRLDLNGEIPEEGSTIVVISSLISSVDGLKKLEKKLEKLYFTNGRGNISFMVLADLKQAKLPSLSEDRSIVKATSSIIRKLNKEYDDKFMLLVRNRVYSKTQGMYTGYERKRGAIEQLIRMIKGEQINYEFFEGNIDKLKSAKYILALDYDTKALMDCASELVAIALHPLNRPVVDTHQGVVSQGYGIIAPRMALDLKQSLSTSFSKVMGGLGGVSAYDTKSGDLYSDLYGEGIFTGKGLISIDAFYTLMCEIFPKETILSHDILEGSFLRTLFVSDVEMIDGFPKNATPFFKRLHRWIRGDFQNVTYLSGKIKTETGETKNPLNKISKFKLFDNLRRAITPVFDIACIITAIFVPANYAITLAIVALLSVVGPYIFGLIRVVISGGIFALQRRYYSKTLSQSKELLLQMFFNFVLLPKFAINAADAIIRALFRRFVSKKNLLEWTTAAQAESKKNDFVTLLREYWFGEVLGIVLVFTNVFILQLFGLIFILGIFLVVLSGREDVKKSSQVAQEKKDELILKAAAMWNFYSDFCTKEDNYLPPDNVQEAPIFKIAHRTSPTNIGLMLLSALCACDLGFISVDELYDRLNNSITTIEKMDKWNGNLYNWYDTRSLTVLEPVYISAVDSGNFVCCLVALKQGLVEYKTQHNEMYRLIERIRDIIEATNIGSFYDKNKKLLYIGYDFHEKKLSKAHYDMLMSEARMTSYFGVAKRQIPKEHWSALGRTLARMNQYTGPVSWTGTMFEYFMPELLLNSIEGSMSYEGLKFCIYCQKRRAKQKNVPFGISESGFYSFDSMLNYKYKANGVQKLALKHGMNNDLVISPYSSYLALSHDFEGAYKNLQQLSGMGAVGKYGHYEAVDFTKERIGDNSFAIVKSYMAHHVGMSIVAICNKLQDNIMQKRFLSDKHMDSAKELLQEKLMVGSVVFDDIYKKEVVRKQHKEAMEKVEYDKIYPQQPRVQLLSNGELTSVLTDIGASYIKYQGQDITRRPSDLLRRPIGIFAGIKYGKEVIPFTFAPLYDNSYEYSVGISSNSVSYITKSDDIQTGMMVLQHSSYCVEQRQFVIKNNTSQKMDTDLMIYIEPALALTQDDTAHPAFSKLFLHVLYDSESNSLVAIRKQRDGGEPVFMAVGFLEDVNFEYEANRENILTTPNGMMSLFDNISKDFGKSTGTPDPAIAIKIKTQIWAHSQTDYTMIISAGKTREQATQAIIDIRTQGIIEQSQAAHSLITTDSVEGRLITSILPQLLFQKRDSKINQQAIEQNQLGKKSLWKMGISGDFPIILVEVISENDSERVKNYINCKEKLNLGRVDFDLVFVFKEGGEYNKPIKNMIVGEICCNSCGNLIGERCGIHLVDSALIDEECITVLSAAASHIAPRSMVRINMPSQDFSPVELLSVSPVSVDCPDSYKISAGEFQKDSFYITTTPKLPFCHILANPSFGTLVSDKALGFTWAINSRENKLTPWYNDTMSDNRGEMLIVGIADKYYDIINGSQAVFNPDSAKYYGKFKTVKSNVSVKVGATGMVKYVDVELYNTGECPVSLDCAYYIEPTLGVTRENARQISGEVTEDQMVVMRNPFNDAVRSYMAMGALDSESNFVFDRAGFLCGRWVEKSQLPLPDPCCAVIVKKELPPQKSEKIRFVLSFGTSKEGALKMSRMPLNKSSDVPHSIQIKTPDKALDHLFDTWLVHQTKASRIYGRTGFFQCGGAYGFRDQLQDVCAYLLIDPKVTRAQILRACASQFEQGDVLHWWHNLPKFGGSKKGVRTRCSDDMLWLPYTVCEYMEKTGDTSLLDIRTKYVVAPELKDSEHEKYVEVGYSDFSETVYEHCKRAIDRGYHLGEHGLVLIGNGDWNDGYNKVGILGTGESVWLSQFLSIVLTRFSKICLKKGEEDLAKDYEQKAQKLLDAIEQHCWDGEWYIRAFFDNGDKMGTHTSAECQIDSLPQSFSVLSDMKNDERKKTAMLSVYEKLVDKEHQIIKLFTPSYDTSEQNPGYVKAYPAGVRENGGQYTHASVWFAMAMLELGETEKGYELIKMLNPAKRYENVDLGKNYLLEPYYMAADIYTNPSAYARGGWSLYTGAAGWYYRAILESLLGIKIKDGKVYIKPNIPKEWDNFEVVMNYSDTLIKVYADKNKSDSSESKKEETVELDGKSHVVHIKI